jgi:hypothetical protein
MTTPADEAAELHAQLKPSAVLAYSQYILSRTRADLQDLMKPLVEGDLTSDPDDPLTTMVSNGDLIAVQAQDGSTFALTPAMAIVADAVLTAVKLPGSSSTVMVRNGDIVAVGDFISGTPIAGSPGMVNVAAGILQDVRLTS